MIKRAPVIEDIICQSGNVQTSLRCPMSDSDLHFHVFAQGHKWNFFYFSPTFDFFTSAYGIRKKIQSYVSNFCDYKVFEKVILSNDMEYGVHFVVLQF